MRYGTIGTLWVEWPLNQIAVLCLRSWVRLGYRVLLYTYDDKSAASAPKMDDVEIRDARGIWNPPYRYKHDRFDSWAPLSDVFRLRMLWEMPVLTWLDLDVALVKRLPDVPDMFSRQDTKLMAACLIRVAGDAVVRERLLELAERCNTTYHVLPWGSCGMLWFDKILADRPDVTVLPHTALQPVPVSRKHELWIKHGRDVLKDPGVYGVHFFNAATRGVDPARNAGSVYDQCWRLVEEVA